MAEQFAHLHLHTQYSLLDGAIRVKDLFPAVLERGMKTVAMTDHGNMYGAVDFFKQAKAHGVKPIFGSEVYVADRGMEDKSVRSSYHLVLLARDEQGYKNLQYLVSMGFLKGFYYNPRIDLKLLKDHTSGLVGMSACLSGQVARTLRNKGLEAAKEVARTYRDIFEPGMFFLELQSNGLQEQEEVNEGLIKIARTLDMPLVATNDCHYVDRKDALAQEVLMCIQQGKTLQDESRMRHTTDEYYLKTPEEMEAAFGHVPEALENVARIADMCNVELDLGHTYLPQFRPPDDMKLDEYLVKVAKEGLEVRFNEIEARGRTIDKDAYRARLKTELDVILQMGFPGYFLIVWDFIRHAKAEGIPVGPGRGSGAGSLVAYSMRITNLDPIEHGLIFERFLNPERVSMPDFDIDFCMNRRDEVLAYVVEKYGKDHVAQIVTHSTLKARGVVRDVARVLGLPYSEADALAKLIPEGPQVTVRSAMDMEPRLKETYEQNETHRKLLDLAMGLEGLHRHAGMHAAGIVIAEKPLWEYVPCSRAQEGQVVQAVSQFAKEEVEEVGLVKFDFLGLKTLTILDETVKRINQLRKADGLEPFDLDALPLDDTEVYAMLQKGDTGGVFQMESSGFANMVKNLRPDRFSDLVAALALYRPGPLKGGMVDDFIARKHGLQEVTYLHPSLKSILEETYGVIVYQEQVMRVASTLAGFSLGQADIMRRAMGKKKAKLLEEQKVAFVDGAEQRGVDRKVAEEIFNLIEMFAGYGFNKSHSACYAVISYQTAYLKCHYPEEYVAGVLTCEKDNADKVVKYLAMAKEMGVSVLAPDINESDVDFSVVRTKDGNKAVRFGLGAIKRVGYAAVDSILEARKDGPFESLYDLTQRVDPKKVNRGVLEALIKAGALDGLAEREGVHRAQMVAGLDMALDLAQRAWRDRTTGQTDLFGALSGKQSRPHIRYPDIEPWSQLEQLRYEREAVGFYVSGHPLDRYAGEVKRFATHNTENAYTALFSGSEGRKRRNWKNRKQVSIAGMVVGYKARLTKDGSGMIAYFELSDKQGRIRVFVPKKAFAGIDEIMPILDEPVLVTGSVSDGQRSNKDRKNGQAQEEHHGTDAGMEEEDKSVEMMADKVVPLSDLRVDQVGHLTIAVTHDELSANKLDKLAKILKNTPEGSCTVTLKVLQPDLWETVLDLPKHLTVKPSDKLVSQIENLFKREVVAFY